MEQEGLARAAAPGKAAPLWVASQQWHPPLRQTRPQRRAFSALCTGCTLGLGAQGSSRESAPRVLACTGEGADVQQRTGGKPGSAVGSERLEEKAVSGEGAESGNVELEGLEDRALGTQECG